MKRVLIGLVVAVFCVSFVHAQSKGRRNNATPCLSASEAKDLIQSLKDFREGHSYLLASGTTRYSLSDIPTIKRNSPISYLFYQKGFVHLEYNGVHTFSSLTSRGEQLDSQYNGSIPLSNLTLISVNRITCTKNKAQVDVTISAKPTQLAVDLLGNAIFKTKPFNTVIKHRMEAKRINGKWLMDELNVIFLE